MPIAQANAACNGVTLWTRTVKRALKFVVSSRRNDGTTLNASASVVPDGLLLSRAPRRSVTLMSPYKLVSLNKSIEALS